MRSSRPLPLLALMLTLASCAISSRPRPNPAPIPGSMPTPKATTAIDPLCVVLRPIELSHADTDGTKAQVIALNSVIDAACTVGK